MYKKGEFIKICPSLDGGASFYHNKMMKILSVNETTYTVDYTFTLLYGLRTNEITNEIMHQFVIKDDECLKEYNKLRLKKLKNII